MTPRRFVTRSRVAALRSAMSERDWAVLSDVARLNVACGRQVRQLHYPNHEAGRRLARMDLARLTEWRVLARLGRRIGGVRAGSDGFVYALDVAG